MPKFVSGSSGHVYSLKNAIEEEDEIPKIAEQSAGFNSTDTKKPSAINKKGYKDQQKSRLDLFKEELRKLNEERDQQRNKLKDSIAGDNSQATDDYKLQQQKVQQSQICIPLKPDPRCPTTLTLQVNLNPRDKDSSASGSFDTGDPSTTNLYLGNLNPSVNENDLCDIFGKFGPLASIKIMWPRTEEERARNRNSGFVAYMSRIDAERAMRTLNGMDIRGYDLKLGWGKAVPLPQNPVFVPPDLVKLLEPPPHTGLPFNAQLHESDLRRNYRPPNPLPRRVSLNQSSDKKDDIEEIERQHQEQERLYAELNEVLKRSTVRVVIPQDRSLLDRIHKTIEYVIRNGPVFEAIIISRERQNLDYKFLYDNQGYEHVYYRWKLHSILHGEDPYNWRTEEFRMFKDGPIWKPPPLNPFADGMPVELIEKSTGVSRDILLNDSSVVHSKKSVASSLDVRSTVRLHLNLGDTRKKGSLGQVKRPQFEQMLEKLKPTRTSIGAAMMFCINHSDAAKEVIECICEANGREPEQIALARKVAFVFLISDVLHNCSAAVTNASFYRQGFREKLVEIFKNLRAYVIHLNDLASNKQKISDEQQSSSTIDTSSTSALIQQQRCDNFKQKMLAVLGAWREWTLYEDEFIIRLSDILLGLPDISAPTDQPAGSKLVELSSGTVTQQTVAPESLEQSKVLRAPEENLDGEPLSEAILIECLEKKGLSLRWYKSLELSEDEEEQAADRTPSRSPPPTQPLPSGAGGESGQRRSKERQSSMGKGDAPGSQVRFKASKWETVDPNEVAEQVVRISKWEAIEAAQRAAEATAATKKRPLTPESPGQLSGSSTSFDDGDDDDEGPNGARSSQLSGSRAAAVKRLRGRHNSSSSSSSSSN